MTDLSLDSTFPSPRNLFNDRFYGAILAFVVHAAIFATGALGLVRGVEYGMDASNGMAEVDLVAAPAPAVAPVHSVATLSQPAHPAVLQPEDVAEQVKASAPPAPPAVTPVPNAVLTTKNLNGPLGDGSSPVPGTDATTIHRAGSGGAYFKPGYYRNPPPPYPEEARKLKQEGRVLLEVLVTTEGKVGSLRIKQSSGHPLLDQSALKSVQSWRFRPATVGGLRVDILADIPIRFQLKS